MLRATVVVFVVLVGVAGALSPVDAQNRPDPVVDRSGVLTAAEQRVLTAAVRDVRQQGEYFATVVVVPSLDGRTARRIANQSAPPPANADAVPTVLVLSQNPPRAEVVVQAGDLDAGQEADIAQTKQRTLEALVADGLGAAGLAYTGGLVEASTESAAVKAARTFVTIVFVVGLLYFGLRALLRWRRTRGVPKGASAIGEVADGRGLVRGTIVSGDWVSIGNSPQLVWYERTDTSWTNRYRQTTWSDGWTETQHIGTDTRTDVSRHGCPFVVSDGTGQAWADGTAVDGYGKKMDSSTWLGALNQHMHWTEGIPLGAEVTLGGPCHRAEDGTLVFEPRGGAGVLLSLTKASAARRIYRRPMWMYLIKAAVWTGIYALLLVVLSGA